MRTIGFAKDRLQATLEEIERLKQSDFPYDHASDALGILSAALEKQLAILNKLRPDAASDVAHNACSISLDQLGNYLPLLGFILRSTNTRNAFEVYSPLLRLSRSVLGKDTKLLLASEWDYSPFVYLSGADLPGFVLIGLPASESSNPLLVPLAGHEIGHPLWEQRRLNTHFDSAVQKSVVRLIEETYWEEYIKYYPHSKKQDLHSLFADWVPAHQWALRQLQEMYCDCLGVRMFSEAYLHAFSYLVSPRTNGERPLYYPNLKQRVAHLERASAAFGVEVPPHFAAEFQDQDSPSDPLTSLLLNVADDVSTSMHGELIKDILEVADKCRLQQRDRDNVKAITTCFKAVVPASDPMRLTDVLNAGWLCAQAGDLWSKNKSIPASARRRILNDLVLKSIEVLEYSDRVKA